MSVPSVGQTMSSYCECANKERGYSAIQTTWVCKAERRGSILRMNIFEYYWECLNCGKKRIIGTWEKKVVFMELLRVLTRFEVDCSLGEAERAQQKRYFPAGSGFVVSSAERFVTPSG